MHTATGLGPGGRAPLSLFAPEPSLAVGADPLAPARELRQLVAGLHAAGFSVILQVPRSCWQVILSEQQQVGSYTGERSQFEADTSATGSRPACGRFAYCTLIFYLISYLISSASHVLSQVQYCFTAEGQPDSRNPSSLLGLDGDIYYRCAATRS